MTAHWSPTGTMASDRRQRLQGEAVEHRLAKLARRAGARKVVQGAPVPDPTLEPALRPVCGEEPAMQTAV